MLKQVKIVDLTLQTDVMAENDWQSLQNLLEQNAPALDPEYTRTLYRKILTECRLSGNETYKTYLTIREHFKTIFVPEHVDHALNSFIDLCEGAFDLSDAVSGPDIRLFAPILDCGLTGPALAHHLLTHPNMRVVNGIFGKLHGSVLWGQFASQERIDAYTCLSAFAHCEAVTDLKAALKRRDHAFKMRYMLEDNLNDQNGDDNVTPLFVCPVPNTKE